MKRLAITLLAWLFSTSLALTQNSGGNPLVPNGASGGGGGGGSFTSFNYTCPATGPLTGVITLPNGIGEIAETGAFTPTAAQCGALFTSTGGASATLPTIGVGTGQVENPYFVIIKNADTTGRSMTISGGGTNINYNGSSAASITLAAGISTALVVNAAGNLWQATSTATTTGGGATNVIDLTSTTSGTVGFGAVTCTGASPNICTYTPTTGLQQVRICITGSGAGGGSGAIEATVSTAQAAGGGGGGASANCGYFTPGVQFTGNLTITLPVGGAGGVSPGSGSTGTNGVNGTAGSDGTVVNSVPTTILAGYHGGYGAGPIAGGASTGGGGSGGLFSGGTNASGSTGGTGGTYGGTSGGSSGGSGATNNSPPFGAGTGGGGGSSTTTSGNGGTGLSGGSGGGGGGGISATDTILTQGCGGALQAIAGGNSSGNGTAGNSYTQLTPNGFVAGTGGCGGQSSVTASATATTGGAGGSAAGGGGGGSCYPSGGSCTPGSGGRGGGAIAEIVEYIGAP